VTSLLYIDTELGEFKLLVKTYLFMVADTAAHEGLMYMAWQKK